MDTLGTQNKTIEPAVDPNRRLVVPDPWINGQEALQCHAVTTEGSEVKPEGNVDLTNNKAEDLHVEKNVRSLPHMVHEVRQLGCQVRPSGEIDALPLWIGRPHETRDHPEVVRDVRARPALEFLDALHLRCVVVVPEQHATTRGCQGRGTGLGKTGRTY